MKQTHGWWWPDHEEHMIKWMDSPKNKVKLNGRWAYQGRKQIATLNTCVKRRRVIDVGGHVGLWAFNFAHSFDHVEAFEPVAAHRECFERNLEGRGNVNLHAVALGAKEGSVSMWSEHGSSGNTQVRGDGDIPMRTLDSFGFTDVDLIKIDTEGFEENVLMGASVTIAKWHPVVIVEQKRDMATRFGCKPMGAVALLQDLGYAVAKEISGDFICTPT
jgi:FkbM family methyltransferase